MKLVIIIITVCLMQVSAATHAQQLTLNEKDVTLEQVFKEIKKQTGYNILYSTLKIDDSRKISVNFNKTPLATVLDMCLKGQPLSYTIEDKTILIKEKEKTPLAAMTAPLAIINVHGRVLDEQSRPVPGAMVRIKGTTQAAITDVKGEFTLKNVDNKAMVEISMIGYTLKSLNVTQEMGNIQLEVATSGLDEVQITAYSQTSRRLSTGNTFTVKAADIEKQPVTNPLLALEGMVPGLVINQSTGFANSGVTVRIQGQNSINQGNDPLYVIDGVPYPSQLFTNIGGPMGGSGSLTALTSGYGATGAGNPLSFIDPLTIESIDILKDADATSIYGSRAANGAILITTKKGKAGQTKVDVNVQSGAGRVGHEMQLLNTPQYLAMRREAFKNDGLPVPTSSTLPNASNYDLTVYDPNRYTDWQKVMLGGTARYDNVQANVSGGTVNTQFLVGAGYHKENTVFPGDFNDRKGSLNFSLNNVSPNQKFRIQLTGNYQIDDNRLPNIDLTSAALRMPPNSPALYNADGSLNWAPLPNGTSSFINPFSYLQNTYRNLTNNLLANMQLSYQILPGLDLKSSFGFNSMESKEQTATPLSAHAPELRSVFQNHLLFGDNAQSTWLIEPQLTYKKVIWKGTLDVLAGGTIQQNKSSFLQIAGSGIGSDLLLDDLASVPPSFLSGAQSLLTLYKYTAEFGHIGYNLQDKYIINLNARRDGSSRFAPENRFHTFASAAGAWIFSNEDFIKNKLSFLSFGKIRGSYGTTGNDQIGEYQYLNQYQSVNTGGTAYQGVQGLTPIGLNNPHLAWELTKKLAAGIDLGFFSDRVLLSAGYFRNRSSNQLLPYSLPYITGASSILSNFPATVQNSGTEFTVNMLNIHTKSFRWSSMLNLTLMKNKLVSFPDQASSTEAFSLLVGQPVNVNMAYRSLGVDPATGLYVLADKNGKPTSSPSPFTDRTVIIDPNPNKHGGFQNSFDYHGFHLDFLLQFAKQKGPSPLLGASPGEFLSVDQNVGPGNLGNQPVSVLGAWHQPGDNSTVQRYSNYFNPFTFPGYQALIGYTYIIQSNRVVVDDSYIRLKNVYLSWQLPENWSHKAGLRNASIFAQGQNLLTITNYKGLDPETPQLFGNQTLPPLRVITFGVKVGL